MFPFRQSVSGFFKNEPFFNQRPTVLMTREFELQVIKRPNNVFSEKEQEGYVFKA